MKKKFSILISTTVVEVGVDNPNANNEFTVTIGREIQAEIIANGRPSPAKLLNAMSNPQTLESLKLVGLVPKETILLEQSDIIDALKLNNINEPKLIE